MPFAIIRNDITKVEAEAIVNSTNRRYQATGGADLVIHKAAGHELDKACKKLPPLETGTAVVTGGFNLKAKYIIHTSAPIWERHENSEELLRKCYVSCLEAAKEKGCESLAFPLISSGVYGCPKDVALKIAMDAIRDFLFENEMTVYLVVYDKKAFQISTKLFENVKTYIDDNYVDDRRTYGLSQSFVSNVSSIYEERRVNPQVLREASAEFECTGHSVPEGLSSDVKENETFAASALLDPDKDNKKFFHALATPKAEKKGSQPKSAKANTDKKKFVLDESFSQMLFRKIDEKGLPDAEVYKKAGISKQIFSNIKSKKDYIPTNATVLSFAVALELDLNETEEILAKAGYALSPSRLFDVIVRYFIENGIYDIYEINATLFQFDQKLLGSK